MSASTGADAPRGPGWWLASDGRYYPPDSAPTADPRAASSSPGDTAGGTDAPGSTSSGATAPRPAKKAAARPSPEAATGGAKKKIKKKVVKKKAASAPPGPAAAPHDDSGTSHHDADEDRTPDFGDMRPGQLKYAATPPGSDQVAARRIQAKEQLVLLSDARQDAALRLLGSLADEVSQPALVGAGPRSLDARPAESAGTAVVRSHTHVTAPGTALPDQPPEPPDTSDPGAVSARTAEPAKPGNGTRAGSTVRTDTVAKHGTPVEPGSTTEPGTSESAPRGVAPAGTGAGPRSGSGTGGTSTPVDPDRPATDAHRDPSDRTEQPTSPAALVVPPHQPVAGPAPAAAPMGTDVPFMEVKGSALGTDIDRIGEKILIFADRVELRDRNNAVCQTIRYDQLAAVEVQKKLMGPTLLIASTAGANMTAKALRPELATGAKAMITKHADRYRGGDRPEARVSPEPEADTTPQRPSSRPDAAAGTEAAASARPSAVPPHAAPTPSPPAATSAAPASGVSAPGVSRPKTHHSVLMAMLDELHSAGILTRDELEAKRSLVDPDPHH